MTNWTMRQAQERPCAAFNDKIEDGPSDVMTSVNSLNLCSRVTHHYFPIFAKQKGAIKHSSFRSNAFHLISARDVFGNCLYDDYLRLRCRLVHQIHVYRRNVCRHFEDDDWNLDHHRGHHGLRLI